VRLIADPDPKVGKWIEAVWRAPDGRLFGWYHAEERVLCARPLFLPHVGAVVSDDEGVSWRCTAEVLRAPSNQTDCSYRNGFFAGGYGDLSALPDRSRSHLYLAFTSYVADETAQGIAMARLPIDTHGTSGKPELWCEAGWRPPGTCLPRPLFRPLRGWRHADPDAFWGPAVHFNRGLHSYVMLLNHTAGGKGDLIQEGIYLSFNTDLTNPQGWSPPLQLVRGGAWYPQVIGLEPGDGDTQAAGRARFFMAGFSAWEIEFSEPRQPPSAPRPLTPSAPDFARLFGAERRCPW
jgi:hypothetical protein